MVRIVARRFNKIIAMGNVREIVCLANSCKRNGRCIAGREVLDNGYGGWIRPVSARPTAELRFWEYCYADSTGPKLLDIVAVPLLHAEPRDHQAENHLIGEGQWVKTGEFPWQEAAANSRSAGIAMDEPRQHQFGRLRLLQSQQESYRGKFEYRGAHYNLSVTDPVARDRFEAKQKGNYPLKDIYLCVSLTAPFEGDGRCHKLVAAIVRDPPL